jgi:acyl-CoA synthetase (NDP forming)
MIESLDGYPILAGTRGERGVDIDAIEEVLVRLGRLAADQDGIVEMDLNPVLAFPGPRGVVVVDARIRIRE